MSVRRGDVVLVAPSRAAGNEIRKARPWVVVSPDDLNAGEFLLLVAPLTTGAHPYVYRAPCKFAGKAGHIVLDQLTTITYDRVRRRIGAVGKQTLADTLAHLREMFAD